MANDTSVTESETTVTEVDTNEQDRGGRSHRNDAFTGWLASSTLRLGLVLVGIFLLLAALGQLSGVDILGALAKFLGTEFGWWLLVATAAIGLIVVAIYGFRGQSD